MSDYLDDGDEPFCLCSHCQSEDCPRWASGWRMGALFGLVLGGVFGAVTVLLVLASLTK